MNLWKRYEGLSVVHAVELWPAGRVAAVRL